MKRAPSALLALALALPLAACIKLPGYPEEQRPSGPPARAAAQPAQQMPAAPAVEPAAEPAPVPAAAPQFRPFQVVDRQQGGLVVGTMAVPVGWQATSNVAWNYSEVSFPVRLAARVSSPDGTAWVECYPAELFYWLEPHDTSTPIGGRSLGMIHAPGLGVQDAVSRFLIGRYRGRAQGLRIVGWRQIPNLPQALGKQPVPGDSVGARIRYTVGGRPVDEEFFAILTQRNRIPYTGPQGTTYEDHRLLAYAFSMGAADGRLDQMARLLGFIVSSFRPDPIWERHREQIQSRLHAQFNANIQAGYQRIAAAGALSRQISANNDAMLRSIEAQRVASNERLSAISRSSGSSSSDAFDQYIRGTERMQDPYWGTSEHSYDSQYHWTDGSGSYRHSNDAGYDPNVGSSQSWTLMQPAR
jgi:hypothetical protein